MSHAMEPHKPKHDLEVSVITLGVAYGASLIGLIVWML